MIVEVEGGRQLMAVGEIRYGTYLIKERAISVTQYPDSLHTRCDWCLREIQQVFYPCRQCIQVKFCNDHCEQQANSIGFHRFECGLVDLFNSDATACHVYRFVSLFGLRNLSEYYKQSKDRGRTTVYDYIRDSELHSCRIEEMSEVNRWKLFDVLDSLVDHREVVSDIDWLAVAWATRLVIIVNFTEGKLLLHTVVLNVHFFPSRIRLLGSQNSHR